MVSSNVRLGRSAEDRRREFVELFEQHRGRLLAYILTLVPNWNDAQELLQETSLRLWTEFDAYQPATNFLAWACRVAYFQVLTYRKKHQRSPGQLSDEAVARLAAEHPSPELASDEAVWLEECLAELKVEHRQLIEAHYSHGLTVAELSGRASKSVDAVYKMLARIRAMLVECVNRRKEQLP